MKSRHQCMFLLLLVRLDHCSKRSRTPRPRRWLVPAEHRKGTGTPPVSPHYFTLSYPKLVDHPLVATIGTRSQIVRSPQPVKSTFRTNSLATSNISHELIGHRSGLPRSREAAPH